jgi:uncharacterized Zn finger protein (UPF0148 family)
MLKNYIIDENSKINFYEELYKSLDEPVSHVDDDLCLITNTPLIENWVKMECNHKFNYVPLYNDILNHKKNFNKLERRFLKSGEIRCPYCRNIQNTLLPYYDVPGVKLVHGVNYFDETVDKQNKIGDTMNNGYVQGACAYTTKYCTVLEDGTNVEKIVSCLSTYVKPFELDGKTYCISHKYLALKEYQKQQKLKAKQDAKDAKILAKLLEKEAKLQAKLLEKEAKAQAKTQSKAEKKKQPVLLENTILDGCVEIIKSGPKKGTLCGCKVKQNNMCGRHMKTLSTVEVEVQV